MKDVKSALRGVKAVVTDLDGTLYDKTGLAQRMVRRLWWCLPLMAVDRLAKGRCWRWIVRTAWHKRVYLPTMVRLIGRYCAPRQEVLNLLTEAKKQGLPIAVYSDYGCIEEKLQVLGIDASLFEVMVSAPQLGARKPSQTAAKKVLALLGADPKTTLFVGDRDDTDGETARLVGAKFLKI